MIQKYSTDFVVANKQSDKTVHHGYQRFYPYFLESLREIDQLKMLELGYDDGYSIEIWKNYFKNPSIDSIDIIENPNDDRLNKFYNVNQDKNEELDVFVQSNTDKYHFIIDDASHIPLHQWNTFIRFLNVVQDGGVYIIEDTETNFWGRSWQYGYGFNSKIFSIYDKVNIINEFINSEFIEENLQEKHQLSDLECAALQQIEMVTLGQNCVIFIKKSKKHKEYYRTFQDYKHKKMVHVDDYSKRNFLQKIADSVVLIFRSKRENK
jgi:hypothetical protein